MSKEAICYDSCKVLLQRYPLAPKLRILAVSSLLKVDLPLLSALHYPIRFDEARMRPPLFTMELTLAPKPLFLLCFLNAGDGYSPFDWRS